MRTVKYASRFKRDYRREKSGVLGRKLDALLAEVVDLLLADKPLPRRGLGMHFGTFQLTDEAIDAPVSASREARADAGVAQDDFDVLGFGETREYEVGAVSR